MGPLAAHGFLHTPEVGFIFLEGSAGLVHPLLSPQRWSLRVSPSPGSWGQAPLAKTNLLLFVLTQSSSSRQEKQNQAEIIEQNIQLRAQMIQKGPRK